MEWFVGIVIFAVLFYFIIMKKHGNLDFWKIATSVPDLAYLYFKENECWFVFEDKPSSGFRNNLPQGEWDGPFKLVVPMLGGKTITIFGKVPDYIQSEHEFMEDYKSL